MSITAKLYLFTFNICVSALWLNVLFKAACHVSSGVFVAYWADVEQTLKLAQTLAILEIFHSLFGIVRSPALTTAMQVASRLILTWIIWHLVPVSREGYALLVCTVAWSASEVLRYPYYALTLFHMVPGFLKWLRYSGFLLLYPLGITCELLCVIKSLRYIKHSQYLRHFPYPMPNSLNFECDLYYTMLAILLIYVPGTLHLYGYMLRQRSKTLSAAVASEKRE